MGFGFSKARLRFLGISPRAWLGRGGVICLRWDVDMAGVCRMLLCNTGEIGYLDLRYLI